jgi:hypothetical protein
MDIIVNGETWYNVSISLNGIYDPSLPSTILIATCMQRGGVESYLLLLIIYIFFVAYSANIIDYEFLVNSITFTWNSPDALFAELL